MSRAKEFIYRVLRIALLSAGGFLLGVTPFAVVAEHEAFLATQANVRLFEAEEMRFHHEMQRSRLRDAYLLGVRDCQSAKVTLP